MIPLLLYFIKSTLNLGIFYFAYLLFFRNQTDFQFNRYYLFFALLLAIFIPLVQIPDFFPADLQNPIGQLSVMQLQEIIIGKTGHSVVTGAGITVTTILWIFYLLGVVVTSIRFLTSLLQLSHLVRKSEIKTDNGIKFVFTTENLPVFSFFRLVFISETLHDNPHASAIINHEKIHIEEKHSLDLLILEIVAIFQWFNPFVYLIKKTMKENHEFIADSGIPVSESHNNSYLYLLFREASGFEYSPITHNFSYSLLKKRMIMMKNQKSQKRMPVKILLSALTIALTLFACNNATQPAAEKSPKVISVTKDKKIIIRNETPAERATIAAQADTGQIFRVVEKMPEYPGGVKALMHYLATTIKYPAEARRAKVQGRVFINFIIEKDGTISHAKVLRGIGSGCDKEALRVVENMPRWMPGEQKGKPVRVEYNLPIKFSLK